MNQANDMFSAMHQTTLILNLISDHEKTLQKIQEFLYQKQKKCPHNLLVLYETHLPYHDEYTLYCPMCGKRDFSYTICKVGDKTLADISGFPQKNASKKLSAFLEIFSDVCKHLQEKKGEVSLEDITKAVDAECKKKAWPLKLIKAHVK